MLLPNREKSKFSVVLIAYNRKIYYKRALYSLASQTRLPENVVMICNFEVEQNALLEEFKLDLTVLNTISPLEGENIIEAIRLCKGDVISFIEDDDEFESNKIERLENYFSAFNTLSFLRNNVRFIDENGYTINDPTPSHRRYISKKHKIYCKDCNSSHLGSFIKADTWFNVSSMSVHKELLIRYSNIISRIWLGLDFFLLYAALDFNQGVMATEERLTRYRIHDGQFNTKDSKDGYIKLAGAFAMAQRLGKSIKQNYVKQNAYISLEFLKVHFLNNINYRKKNIFLFILLKLVIKPRGFYSFFESHPFFSIQSLYILLKHIII